MGFSLSNILFSLFFHTVSVHDSSDDSLVLGNEYDADVIKVPLVEPSVNCWIATKVEKITKSQEGRLLRPFEIYIARVSKVIHT